MPMEVLLQDYIDHNPGWWAMTGGFHMHRQDELILLSKGAAASTCLGRIVEVKAPAVIFYPHGATHRQRNDESLPYLRHAVRYLPGDLDGCVPFDSLPRDFFALSLTEAEFARLSPYLPLLLEEEPAETREVRRWKECRGVQNGGYHADQNVEVVSSTSISNQGSSFTIAELEDYFNNDSVL